MCCKIDQRRKTGQNDSVPDFSASPIDSSQGGVKFGEEGETKNATNESKVPLTLRSSWIAKVDDPPTVETVGKNAIFANAAVKFILNERLNSAEATPYGASRRCSRIYLLLKSGAPKVRPAPAMRGGRSSSKSCAAIPR